jgi:hypothetical protein
MKKLWMLPVLLVGFAALAPACKPRTASQKIEDKAEDASHDVGQAAERAGENVHDATK